MPFGLAGYLAENSGQTPMTCIVRTMWTLEVDAHLAELVMVWHAFRGSYPHIRVIIAANTPHEAELLAEAGVEAILANHNMFLDEQVFRPLPRIEPTYDAVYNANFSPFKRRELTAVIETCVHLGYFSDTAMLKEALPLFRQARRALPHHHFANPIKDERVVRIPSARVNAILASAHVGLCLSAEEGAMIAAMEYLLAGLPVVSTPSLGGRERYFDPEFSIIVEPDPRKVRDAVLALKARAIPRSAVRQRTLRLVRRDREAFNSFIDGLREGYPSVETEDERFSFHYVNNLYQHTPLAELCRQLGFPLSYLGQPPNVMAMLERGMDDDGETG